MISKLISPVSGSVADLRVAKFIRLMASSTSSYVTSEDNLILANASLILMRDSSCLGVAVIVCLLSPFFLIS